MTKGRKGYGKPVAVETVYTLINGQVLPDYVREVFNSIKEKDDTLVRNSYMAALRHAGWTLQAVANATGLSRERIRQIEVKVAPDLVEQIRMFPKEFPIPALPTETVVSYKYEAYEPLPETLSRLKELQPYAQLVRSHSPRYRAEAEEYAALLWKAYNEENVTLYHLAKLLGITHSAIRFRLARYGYIEPARGGNSRSYRRIIDKNRAKV